MARIHLGKVKESSFATLKIDKRTLLDILGEKKVSIRREGGRE